mmetsp:Transcript_24777/g.51162  ORF Transcript_24777/g.51162 Transcript_24777/m.51162 type:complete len:105 (-) Transcript_24777:92-406(-)|eukprot:CAMPEP_0182533380 /NCGR_PEP_ID=MMETSP1323-20130603/13649_1 /TAXON_ID=236787 /ORGANISM="Florenciella parvula, Strain RCC1693" /LENGTH=104 /DNA_ID=CAMNT_0024743251 /DNA_START=82 /DNA_END=396 /DNA_ORIENTATION=+
MASKAPLTAKYDVKKMNALMKIEESFMEKLVEFHGAEDEDGLPDACQEIDLNEVANMALAEEQMTELRSKVALQMGVIGGEPNQPVDALLQGVVDELAELAASS